MTEFRRVFIDTAPIIYYLENSALYKDSVKKFFEKCIRENIKVVTSAITIEEYLVYPYSSGKMEFADNFKKFIEYMGMEVVDIDSNIAEQGAKIRGRYKNFKAMDALQIAAAVARACLKIHSRNLSPHFTPAFMLNFVNVAHYTSEIQHKT